MKTAASIFKAYDIRGVVGQTIDEAFAEHLGRAFGSEAVAAGERAVALARAAHATEDAERYAEQLARYRAGQPFHFPPPGPSRP